MAHENKKRTPFSGDRKPIKPEPNSHRLSRPVNTRNERLDIMTKDPICGMSVDKASAVHAERDGKTFYFCSAGCRQKFLALPAARDTKQKSGGFRG